MNRKFQNNLTRTEPVGVVNLVDSAYCAEAIRPRIQQIIGQKKETLTLQSPVEKEGTQRLATYLFFVP